MAMSTTISKLENSGGPLASVRLAVVDANAWIIAASRRIEKANKLLGEINAARAKADPPLSAIPLIPLPQPIDFIGPDTDPGSAPSPSESDAGPALPPPTPRAKRQGGDGR
jgi:hypothetical protein